MVKKCALLTLSLITALIFLMQTGFSANSEKSAEFEKSEFIPEYDLENIPIIQSAAIPPEGVSGTCGASASWSLVSDGTLTVSGSGEMTDFNESSPWYAYAVEIKNIVIGNQITSLGSYAFYHCTNITSVEIPSSVTAIGDYVFYGCSLLATVNIPSSVKSIGAGAFSYCTVLSQIEIPSSVKTIGNNAFTKCKALTEIKIPSSVTGMGNGVFSYCSLLTEIEIPASVENFGSSVFSKCTALKSVTFASGSKIPGIGNTAFDGCTSLTTINIPSTVTSIGSFAFDGCTKLTSVYFEGDAPLTVGTGAFLADKVTLYYIDGKNGWTKSTWNGYKTETYTPTASVTDINSDGCTDILDAILIKNAVSNKSTDTKYDVNGDKTVDNADILFVIDMILKN